jgi:ribosomal protein S18 acetylase RimI-like enzyme
VLLAEGLHMLAARQAGHIRLEVAVENERALELYQRAGFAVARSTSTWRQRLARQH